MAYLCALRFAPLLIFLDNETQCLIITAELLKLKGEIVAQICCRADSLPEGLRDTFSKVSARVHLPQESHFYPEKNRELFYENLWHLLCAVLFATHLPKSMVNVFKDRLERSDFVIYLNA